MIQSRLLICLLMAAVSAAAQTPAPVPVPPLPPVAPLPQIAPLAPVAPVPPEPPTAFAKPLGRGLGIGNGISVGIGDGLGDVIRDSVRGALAFAQPKAAAFARKGNEDFLYESGQTALDNRRWEQALDDFSQVVTRGGTRTEGALYWKAYALNKLGRRDEALAAIAELRKSYASSRWLEDAKVLELETKQAAGQSVSPESESDEDLKLLALNGLMQSDPDRALPLVENLLKGNQPPKLKKNAVYVIAQNTSPRAQQLLEQVARGSVNPDLQIVAIRYLTQQKRNLANMVPLLWEIYGSTTDVNVKREIVNGLSTDHLMQVAKSDKAPELRLLAIQRLGNGGGGDALVPIYAAETDAQVRQAIVNTLSSQRNAKALVALARAERDPQIKKNIVQNLVNMKSPDATDYLMEILK